MTEELKKDNEGGLDEDFIENYQDPELTPEGQAYLQMAREMNHKLESLQIEMDKIKSEYEKPLEALRLAMDQKDIEINKELIREK